MEEIAILQICLGQTLRDTAPPEAPKNVVIQSQSPSAKKTDVTPPNAPQGGTIEIK